MITLRALLVGALLALPALAAFAAPHASADPILIPPFTNGRFELGARGWTFGPGTTVGDADYSGDSEAVLVGETSDARLAQGFDHGPSPASLVLSFNVEKGTLSGVSLRVVLLDLRDPQTYLANAGSLAPDYGRDAVLGWDFATLGKGRLYLDTVDASFYTNPAWAGMTPEERASEMQNFVVGTVVFTAASAVGPAGSATVDDFGFGVGDAGLLPI